MAQISSNILVVEDDKDDQALIEMAFRKLSIPNPIINLRNGEEALAYLRDRSNPIPFIIISDINMPKLNGLELLKEIQKDEYLTAKAIPFVFFSSSSSQADVLEAYQQRAQGYFEKPVAFRETLITLKMVMDYWGRCLHPKVVD